MIEREPLLKWSLIAVGFFTLTACGSAEHLQVDGGAGEDVGLPDSGNAPDSGGGGTFDPDKNINASLEDVAAAAGYIIAGRAAQVDKDMYKGILDHNDGNLDVFYYDAVIFNNNISGRIGPVSFEPYFRLYPTRCEFFKNSVPVTGKTSPLCSMRRQFNSVAVGDKMIGFSDGLGSRATPPFLTLRLSVSDDDIVDLSPLFLEASKTAPLTEVMARMRKVRGN